MSNTFGGDPNMKYKQSEAARDRPADRIDATLKQVREQINTVRDIHSEISRVLDKMYGPWPADATSQASPIAVTLHDHLTELGDALRSFQNEFHSRVLG